MSYRKICKHNDWGAIYYAYEGEGLSTAGTASAKLGINLAGGQNLKVRWPDGSTSEEVLVAKKTSFTVTDHGKDSTVTSDVYGVGVAYRGTKSFVDLEVLEIFDPGDEGEWSLL